MRSTIAAHARGSVHQLTDQPYEDSSAVLDDSEGRFAIACVADGVGDPTCSRSSKGAALACAVAQDALARLAAMLLANAGGGSVAELFGSDREVPVFEDGSVTTLSQAEVAQRMVDRVRGQIVSDWRTRVQAEADALPPTPDEQAAVDAHTPGPGPAYLFACTLVAALRVGDALLLFQQGDGECLALATDGTVSRPMPGDARCDGRGTTTLCDPDAPGRMRRKAIDLRHYPVAAVMVSTDGVANSFDDASGLDGLLRSLCADAYEHGLDGLEKGLDLRMEELSAAGSGDDCTLAAILDEGLLGGMGDGLVREREVQAATDELMHVDSKIASMTRKDGHLRQAAEAAAAASRSRPADVAALAALAQAMAEQCESMIRTLEGMLGELELAAGVTEPAEVAEYREYHARFEALRARRGELAGRLAKLEEREAQPCQAPR